MYHSIIISEKNTYDDWGLVPTSRPVINMPEVKVYTVDVPGADGVLDYTEVLSGAPTYGQRTGSWEFHTKPGAVWASLFSEIAAYLHGKYHIVTLEDDPDYTYEGRLSVNQWRSEEAHSLITIDYILGPYKSDASGGLHL